MLVRNLTKVSLPLRKHGKKIVLLPGKVTEVPDVMFTSDQVKNIYGSFVQVLNEKLVPVEEPVVEQTIEVKIEDSTTAKAVEEVIEKAEEAKAVEEEPVTVVEEVKEEAAEVEELVKEETPAPADDFEEISIAGIAEYAEEVIEDAKETVEEKPAKKTTKKSTAKKTTKKK